MKKFNKKINAFTLLELSISLMIIAVLIAGIMKGGSMITESSQLTRKWQVRNSDGIYMPNVLFGKKNKLWLDAANINGSYNAGIKEGEMISLWKDLSVSENDANQSNASLRPKYNGYTLVFDGSNDHFVLPNVLAEAKKATGIIVIKDTRTNGSRNNGHWDFGNYGYVMNHYGGGPRQVYDNFCMNWRPLTAENVQINKQTQIYMVQNDGSQLTTYMDGKLHKQQDSNGFYARSNPVIGRGWGSGNTGGSYYFEGEISEVIIFNDILSDKERIQTINYLAKKWKLSATVDSDDDGIFDNQDSELNIP